MQLNDLLKMEEHFWSELAWGTEANPHSTGYGGKLKVRELLYSRCFVAHSGHFPCHFQDKNVLNFWLGKVLASPFKYKNEKTWDEIIKICGYISILWWGLDFMSNKMDQIDVDHVVREWLLPPTETSCTRSMDNLRILTHQFETIQFTLNLSKLS